MDALRIDGLCKEYDSFKLQDISFAVEQGTIMGFIGENGAGKTTTIKAALNLVSRRAGTVEILGCDSVRQEREAKEQIGVVFDASHFHEQLTPAAIAKIYGNIYPSWDDALYTAYLRRFSLPAGKVVKEFSRGMLMKLNLAAALAHRPRLLLLDEATGGLDPVVREEILDLFLEYIQDEQNSILLSSHITSDLDKIADTVTFIHEGRIVFCRQKDALLEDLGVLRCGAAQLEGMLSGAERAAEFPAPGVSRILRWRKSQFGAEALVSGRDRFRAAHPGAVIEPASLEQIMLFYARGQE